MMRSAKAFTLTDLCIATVLILLIGALMFPMAMTRSREMANRIKCSSNLRQMGLAMKMYANEEVRTLAYPRTKYASDRPTVWGTGNGDVAAMIANPFNPINLSGGTDYNDVTSAMFLLIRTQDITTDVFICPSTGTQPYGIERGQTAQNYTNWSKGNGDRSINKTLSYSYQNPYPSDEGAKNGFIFNDSMAADFAIAADLNSGAPELLTTLMNAPGSQQRKINSPNHDYDGQNVLYADGHVDWATTPFVGVQNDNIYTAGPNPIAAHPKIKAAVEIVGMPGDANDTIVLPTWDSSIPLPTPRATSTTRLLIVVGIALLLLLIAAGGIVAFLIFRKKPPQQPPFAGSHGGAPPPLPRS